MGFKSVGQHWGGGGTGEACEPFRAGPGGVSAGHGGEKRVHGANPGLAQRPSGAERSGTPPPPPAGACLG